MDREDFKAKIKEAADTNQKVEIAFQREVMIPIHKKYKPVKSVKVVIFSASTISDSPNEDLPYGYKMRVIDRTGYRVNMLPINLIESIEYVEDQKTTTEQMRKFKMYVNQNRDPDVWPNIDKVIDNLSGNRPYSEYSAKLYLASKFDEWDMMAIKEMFDKRLSGKHYLGGIDSEKHVLTELREDGYYAWYTDGTHTWIMINPRVGILGRRSI